MRLPISVRFAGGGCGSLTPLHAYVMPAAPQLFGARQPATTAFWTNRTLLPISDLGPISHRF